MILEYRIVLVEYDAERHSNMADNPLTITHSNGSHVDDVLTEHDR